MNNLKVRVSRSFFNLIIILSVGISFVALFSANTNNLNDLDAKYLIRTVDLTESELHFYWKDKQGRTIGSIGNLNKYCQSMNQELVFAMNGGMYLTDQSPQGLYIENNQMLKGLDTSSGYGNFYLKPNGVFYLTDDKKCQIVTTEKFILKSKIKFATQSGPMLLINGQMHSAFKKGSSNVHIRNGVGLLSDSRIVFVMSKKEVNLYDFAAIFKELGCKDALYLDGFVSRSYLPSENWIQTDGSFGVIIAEIKNK
jgi:uncharacterized protein YigE (DUF2233 family)